MELTHLGSEASLCDLIFLIKTIIMFSKLQNYHQFGWTIMHFIKVKLNAESHTFKNKLSIATLDGLICINSLNYKKTIILEIILFILYHS